MTPLKLVCHPWTSLTRSVPKFARPDFVSVTPTEFNHLHHQRHQRHLGNYAPRRKANVGLHCDWNI